MHCVSSKILFKAHCKIPYICFQNLWMTHFKQFLAEKQKRNTLCDHTLLIYGSLYVEGFINFMYQKKKLKF
jgi:hypothetical protein